MKAVLEFNLTEPADSAEFYGAVNASELSFIVTELLGKIARLADRPETEHISDDLLLFFDQMCNDSGIQLDKFIY